MGSTFFALREKSSLREAVARAARQVCYTCGMKQEALITILVPIYQVEDYLVRCLESIQGQTLQAFTCLLIDDGSRDEVAVRCREVIARDARFRLIQQRNAGVSAARNRGLEALPTTPGDYVTFVDPDDWVAPTYLETLYTLLTKHHTAIACCGHREVSTFPDPPCEEPPAAPEELFSGRDLLLHREAFLPAISMASLWCKLFHKRLFQDLRLPVGRRYEDSACIYRLLYPEPTIALTRAPRYAYWMRPDSIIHSRATLHSLDYCLALLEEIDFFSTRDAALYHHAIAFYFTEGVHWCHKILRKLALPRATRRELVERYIRQPYLRYRRDCPIPLLTNRPLLRELHPCLAPLAKLLSYFKKK